MDRRRFITQTGSLTATASLIGTAGRWANANDTIRIAQIGMGTRGGQLMRSFYKIDGVEIAAMCDPDPKRVNEKADELQNLTDKRPKTYSDLRDVIQDDSIDAIVITTCNHWHALATIWGCQNGKHVYVEKPVAHNIFEGRKMVEASRKYNRIVQGGTQRRSFGRYQKGIEALHDGIIGDVYMSRTLIYVSRNSIGFQQPQQPPEGFNWNMWLGPAPEQPFHKNLVHYNWHWFWDFGNGEIGNNAIHMLDIARWGMQKGHPNQIYSTGGRYGYKDQGQTPNTQTASFEYDDGTYMECEVRGLYTNDETEMKVGVRFYGSKGYMTLQDDRCLVFMGRDEKPSHEFNGENVNHQQNFIEAVRAEDRKLQNADIEKTFLSTSLCLLANISYRLDRKLTFDPLKEIFPGDEEANRMLTRDYREPFVVPKEV